MQAQHQNLLNNSNFPHSNLKYAQIDIATSNSHNKKSFVKLNLFLFKFLRKRAKIIEKQVNNRITVLLTSAAFFPSTNFRKKYLNKNF